MSKLVTTIALALAVSAGAAWAGPDSGKAGEALRDLHDRYVEQQTWGIAAAPLAAGDRPSRVIGDRVVIDATAAGDPRALEADLIALGMRNTAVFGRVVSGQLPLSAIPALETLASLGMARPAFARRRAGPTTTEGDHAIRADLARATFGVSGAGVQVGVLSDSFDCLGGAAADVASGELSPVTVLEEIDGCGDGTDEGRALLHIVHDVAPGASLSFATAFNGKASFAQNILALRDNGARVIVDDIIYFDEPMFQDGIIAQAVDAVVATGTAFFSAAGNEGRRGYESPFRAGTSFPSNAFGPSFFGGVAHNFAPPGDPPDHMQRITIPGGATLTVSLQWDSPFLSVSGPPGTPNDVDVYLLNSAGTAVIARDTSNDLGRDAVAILDFTNNGPTANFNLMIVKFTGPDPGFVKYVQLGSASITIGQFDTASGTVYGHANAAGAAAVGAVFFEETPAFGFSPPVKESYSSAGPTPILFDLAGVRHPTPVVRPKPQIMGPDGVDTGHFTPFFGTSAAAPHAAAVAALMLERQPALSPAAIYGALEATALDMATPGFDFDTGFGLIRADAAVQLVSPPVTLGLTLNVGQITAGAPVQVGVTVASAGGALLQDLYFVLLVPPALSTTLGCPAGDALVFLTSNFTGAAPRCATSSSPATFPPLIPSMSIPAAPGSIDSPNFLTFAWPAGLPAGVYTFGIVTTLPGAFTDGIIGAGDLSAAAAATLSASP